MCAFPPQGGMAKIILRHPLVTADFPVQYPRTAHLGRLMCGSSTPAQQSASARPRHGTVGPAGIGHRGTTGAHGRPWPTGAARPQPVRGPRPAASRQGRRPGGAHRGRPRLPAGPATGGSARHRGPGHRHRRRPSGGCTGRGPRRGPSGPGAPARTAARSGRQGLPAASPPRDIASPPIASPPDRLPVRVSPEGSKAARRTRARGATARRPAPPDPAKPVPVRPYTLRTGAGPASGTRRRPAETPPAGWSGVCKPGPPGNSRAGFCRKRHESWTDRDGSA